MDKVMFFSESIPEIGLKARKSIEGSEYKLVENFVEFKVTKFERMKNRKINLAIFSEPLIETGFPDIVIAEYDPNTFEKWSSNRSKLGLADLKVLNHIIYIGETQGLEIQQQLGIESKLLLTVIEKLLDAGLIIRQANKWKAKRLKDIYGIKRLVAIEAKMSNWGGVFGQAQLNKWFASESYTLSPVAQPTDKIVKRSEELGVGIYVSNSKGIKKIRTSPVTPLPACYGSLLFNEWIGRRLNKSN